MNFIREKRKLKIHLKQNIIFNLLFFYKKIFLLDSDIIILEDIKVQLTTKKKIFDKDQAVTNLAQIASAIIKQKKYGAKLNGEKLKIIKEIINKLDRMRTVRTLKPELKRYIINKLIFFYDNISVDDRDARILAALMQKKNGFDKEKRMKNISWIASILIKKGKYSKQKKAVKEIIKELKTEIRSSSDQEFQKETLASLGSIAQYLIDKRYANDADDFIIKFFKEVIEATKKYDIEVRTKAIGQLYGVSKKFIQKAAKKPKSLYNEKQDKIKRKKKRKTKKRTIYEIYLEKVRAITKDMMTSASKTREFEIRRKCVAELGAILIRYEEQAAKFKEESIQENLDNKSERFATQFEDPKHGKTMNKTASKLLNELREIRQKSEAKQIIPEMKESDMRALVEKEEEPKLEAEKEKKVKLVKRKLRRKRFYLRKKRKVMLNMDPDILQITRALVGEQYLRKMKKNKHLENNYIKHIVPLIKDLKKIERDEEIGEIKLYNGIKEFIAPMVSLRKELRHLGIHKSCRDITVCFPNLKTDLNTLDEYFRYYLRKYLRSKRKEQELEVCLDDNKPEGRSGIWMKYRDDNNDLLANYLWLDMLYKKVEIRQNQLIQQGKKDSVMYKDLARFMKRITPIYSPFIIYTTPKDMLEQLEKLGLIDIKHGCLFKRAKNISIKHFTKVSMGLTAKYRKNFRLFLSYLRFLESSEFMRRDFVIGEEKTSKKVEKLKKKLSEITTWPQDRNFFNIMLSDLKELNSLTGSMRVHNIMANFCGNLTDVFRDAKTIIEWVKVEDSDTEEAIISKIRDSFSVEIKYLSTPKKMIHKKLVFVLKSSLNNEALKQIKRLVNKDRELIFLVKKKPRGMKNLGNNIHFETELTIINGEIIKFDDIKEDLNPVIMWPSCICEFDSDGAIGKKIDLIMTQVREQFAMMIYIIRHFKNNLESLDKEFELSKIENRMNKIGTVINNATEAALFFAVERNDKELARKLIESGACLDILTKDGNNLFKMAARVAMVEKDFGMFEFLVSELSTRKILFQEALTTSSLEYFKQYGQSLYKNKWEFLTAEKQEEIIKEIIKKSLEDIKQYIEFRYKVDYQVLNNKERKSMRRKADVELQQARMEQNLKDLKGDVKKYIKILYKDEWGFLTAEEQAYPIKYFHKLKLLRRINDIIKTYKNIDENIKSLLQELVINLYNTPAKVVPSIQELEALKEAV